MKSQKQDSQGVALLKRDGKLLSDALSKAKILGNQFSSVFTKDAPDTANIRKEGPSYSPLPDLVITTEGVEKLLAGLNPSKAAGPDGISARLLKNCSREVAPVIRGIFQQTL